MKAFFKWRFWALFGLFFSVASLILFLNVVLFVLFSQIEDQYIFDEIALGNLAFYILTAFVALIFYVVDSLRFKRHLISDGSSKIKALLPNLILGGFPCLLLCGGNVFVFVWILYHIMLLILIIIDISRDCKVFFN